MGTASKRSLGTKTRSGGSTARSHDGVRVGEPIFTSSLDPNTDDDAPVPIPSTWTSPPATSRETERGSDTLRAGIMGFVLGLIVIVPIAIAAAEPTVPGGPFGDDAGAQHRIAALGDFWADPGTTLASWIAYARNRAMAVPTPTLAAPPAAPRGPVAVAKAEPPALPEPEAVASGLSAASLADRIPAANSGSGLPRTKPNAILNTADALIADGDIATARAVLNSARAAGNGDILFRLAETYDPSVLGAWGARDTVPDANRARGLYVLALLAGITRAKARLDALPAAD